MRDDISPLFSDPRKTARLAGLFYLIIIVCGIWAEIVVRSSLIVPEDAATTARNILAAEGLFRLSFVADMVMAISDVALGVLLFVLLRRVEPVLALMAMIFRLLQAAIIGMNLINMQASLLLLTGGEPLSGLSEATIQALASFWVDPSGAGI